MQQPPTSPAPPHILALIVLYQRDILQSQAVSSLLAMLHQAPELAEFYSLLLYDNSPQAHSLMPHAPLPVAYVHDPDNGGLARAYNVALRRAETENRQWLLLLDQDTTLTREFLLELLQAAQMLEAAQEVSAIVPKLRVHGEIHSPALNFIGLLRRQFQPPLAGMDEEVAGIQTRHLYAYNSGSTLRVSAVRSIGGFPPEFWLDFLDHAIFQALFVHGYRTYVMRATLEHDFSHTEIGSVPKWRFENVLAARTLFIVRNGTFFDRLLYRIWLLRHARKLWQEHKNSYMWKQTALHALRFRLPDHAGKISHS